MNGTPFLNLEALLFMLGDVQIVFKINEPRTKQVLKYIRGRDGKAISVILNVISVIYILV
jgi:hypothetical protein